MTRFEAVSAVLIWSLIVAWLVFGTAQLIKPLSLSYANGSFDFVRETPYGGIWASWTQEARSPLGDCAEPGSSFYQDQGLEPVRWEASDRLARCIPEAGEVFILETKRTARILGVIPLRASYSTWSCVVDGGLCELIE